MNSEVLHHPGVAQVLRATDMQLPIFTALSNSLYMNNSLHLRFGIYCDRHIGY